MRDRIIAERGGLAFPRFLVSLMSPYTAFDIGILVERTERTDSPDHGAIPEISDFGSLVDSDGYFNGETALRDLLIYVRDRLRDLSGVNAFLAIDIDIPLDEMDAATQSIEFALASNAVVYIIPAIGDNLGVGIEVGSVSEAIYRAEEQRAPGTPHHHERVAFVHELGIESAMIAAVRDRWEVRIVTYHNRDGLVSAVRRFVRDIAHREQRGDLPSLDP